MDEVYTDGEHLVTWQFGEWGRLIDLADYYLRHDGEREEIRQAGRAHVMEHHTYEVRAEQIVELCQEQNLL